MPYRRYSPQAVRHDLVRFQSRQYSLDERREMIATKAIDMNKFYDKHVFGTFLLELVYDFFVNKELSCYEFLLKWYCLCLSLKQIQKVICLNN